MALFTTAAEWDTDPATDKLCDMLLSHQPKIKKKKHMKKSMLSGMLGENSKQKPLKEEEMRHAQRYQKNRKKKQMMLKKTIKQSEEEEGMKDKKVKKKKKLDADSDEKAKSEPETAVVKESNMHGTSTDVEFKVKKKKKVRKDSAKKEEDATSPVMKKEKNKYKHLAGKGKRMETLSLSNDVASLGTSETPRQEESKMDVDNDFNKKVSKSGVKRKLEESCELTPKKKKLKQTGLKVVESNGDSEKQKRGKQKGISLPDELNMDFSSAPEKKQKKKKKKKPTDILQNGNTGANTEESVRTISENSIEGQMPKMLKNEETTKPVDTEPIDSSATGITEKKKKKKKKKPSDMIKNGNASVKTQESPRTISEDSVNTKVKVTDSKLHPLKSPKQLDKIRSILEAKDSKSSSPSVPKSLQVTSPKKQPVKKSGPLSLKERMEEQLKASRFRYLNEQLYTSDSKSAQELFAEDPEAFQVYHHGYQAQVSKWPANPVDRAISYVKARDQSVVVADFGCGDAKLAQSVPNKVHSFDLVAVNKHVTVADSANVPLKDKSVDIAVFSLSLMGTNFVDFLIEANRVLKQSGTLLIAEVVSRFEKVPKFVKKLEKLGFKLVNMDKNNKMFIWFELSKTKTITQDTDIPDLELLPCIYKKR